MHGGVGVQLVDQRVEIGLSNIHGQLVLKTGHPNLGCRDALVANVDLTGRVLAHQHDG